MPRRKEVPYSPIPVRVANHDGESGYQENPPDGIPVFGNIRESELAALMEAAPHEPVGASTEALLPLRDVLADAIDQLAPRKRWIFEALVIERKSIRGVAADLNLTKSYVHRIKDEAVLELRELLADHPLIKEHLHT